MAEDNKINYGYKGFCPPTTPILDGFYRKIDLPLEIVSLSKSTLGIKHDKGKNRISLVPVEIIKGIGKVLTYGAIKYSEGGGPHNWRKGIEYSRVVDALLRHLFSYLGGERNDLESGLPHLYHLATNLAFLITYEEHPETYEVNNDLYAYKKED